MDNQYRPRIIFYHGQIVEGIANQKRRKQKFFGQGPGTGKGRHQDEGCRRLFGRQGAEGPAAQRAAEKNDARTVDILSGCQNIISGLKSSGNALLGGGARRTTIAGVFHQQQGYSETGEPFKFSGPEIN